jgi:TPP-dependent pyruvate/acetoin dehydrogenase alpha subunit
LAKDPIARFEVYLIGQHVLTPAQKAEIEARVKAVVDDAVCFAEQSPPPDETTVADYVFAPAGPIAIVGEPGSTNESKVY